MATELNPFDHLCCHDPLYSYFEEMEDYEVVPRVDCACDACYYGKDELAIEVIRLRKLLEENEIEY